VCLREGRTACRQTGRQTDRQTETDAIGIAIGIGIALALCASKALARCDRWVHRYRDASHRYRDQISINKYRASASTMTRQDKPRRIVIGDAADSRKRNSIYMLSIYIRERVYIKRTPEESGGNQRQPTYNGNDQRGNDPAWRTSKCKVERERGE
jgi:hypothetical protein